MNRPATGSGFLDNERTFKYLLIAPAILLLLLIGLYPFVKLVVVSFQNISMFDDIRSFQGFIHYSRLFEDARLWESLLHTVLFTAVALPIELVLGYLLALLFLRNIPFKQVLVAIILLPTRVHDSRQNDLPVWAVWACKRPLWAGSPPSLESLFRIIQYPASENIEPDPKP